jgi:hypothetical protein
MKKINLFWFYFITFNFISKEFPVSNKDYFFKED